MPLHVFFPCFGTKTVPFLERELCIRHGFTLLYTSSVRQAASHVLRCVTGISPFSVTFVMGITRLVSVIFAVNAVGVGKRATFQGTVPYCGAILIMLSPASPQWVILPLLRQPVLQMFLLRLCPPVSSRARETGHEGPSCNFVPLTTVTDGSLSFFFLLSYVPSV